MKARIKSSRIKSLCIIITVILLLFTMGCSGSPEKSRSETESMVFEGQIIEADNPLIQYTGRIDFSKPKAPAFAFPGTLISARFTGSKIAVILDDSSTDDYFAVIIDGEEFGAIQSKGYPETFFLANNLSREEHSIQIFKRTEAFCGIAIFKGFLIDEGASLIQTGPTHDKRIEFVGDSITCGYGNLVSTTNPNNDHFTPENEDNTLAWGAVASRELNASYISTSFSGKGVLRNLDGSKSRTMPLLYHSIYPEDPDKAYWDAAGWNPDLIVINLGTNDYGWEGFQAGLEFKDFDTPFVDTYTAFIKDLRATHGDDVEIICVIGPMMGDSYPPGRNALTRIRAGVSGMVQQLRADGDEAIYFLELPAQQSPYGEDWHPTAATHQEMGERLADFIRINLVGWNS